MRLRIPDEHLARTQHGGARVFPQLERRAHSPASLEPFKLDAPNPSGELWFAEGFTSYYGAARCCSGRVCTSIDEYASRLGYSLDLVMRSPARKYRSAEEVSRLAQFVDAAVWTDPTNLDNNFVSYYDWGAVIGLGLDLSLRARTDHKVTLDDYMRRMWQEFGRPAPAAEGTVARPYTMQDLRRVLADVSGDRAFADDFFDRFIQGREVVDYAPLLSRAGLVLRKRNPGPPLDWRRVARLQRWHAASGRADHRGHAVVRRRARSRR